MKGSSSHWFHSFLLLTERPGRWPVWAIWPIALLLAAAAGVLWADLAGSNPAGWWVGGGFVAFALADWALLSALPRFGLSFGAVQPPWLALLALRWLFVVALLPFAANWPLPALVSLAVLQALVSTLAAWGTLVEPFRLQVSQVDIETANLSCQTPVRIVQLSDLHIERQSPRERALPALVADLNPDLIALTGDFLNTSYQDDPQAVDDLKALLGQLYAPGGIYAVWGTVEVDLPDLLRPVLEELGILVLEDQAREVTIHGDRFWLMGVNPTRDLAADAERTLGLLARAPSGACPILLYHLPDLMPPVSKTGIDLYLAGHTHGGQWRLPGFGAILTSSRYWKRYESGHYQAGDSHLYVSRGIGMEGFGTPRARLFCPPEVVLLKLAGEARGRGRHD